jgi:hypothetical protein
MARDAASFRRGSSKYLSEPTILVLCEDSKSSKHYLEDARRHFRIQAHIHHCKRTDPLGIVQEAISQERKYDRIYCAIDRDRHCSFDEALRLAANREKLHVIASYPCFEYWLLLHFRYTRRPYVAAGNLSPADVVLRDLRRQDGLAGYEKGSKVTLFLALLGEPLSLARQHAPRVLREALNSNELNPSTELHLLIDRVRGKPRPSQGGGDSADGVAILFLTLLRRLLLLNVLPNHLDRRTAATFRKVAWRPKSATPQLCLNGRVILTANHPTRYAFHAIHSIGNGYLGG